MAQKEDLKELLEQYFPDNNTGEITEPKVREFLGKVIDLIPEIAGGDLAGTYPSPTVGAKKITAAKIADKTITKAQIADRTITAAQIAEESLNDESIFADEIITGRVIQKNAITAQLLERTLAPCVVDGIKNISISNILTIPITDLFTYNTVNGKWQSTVVNITNATSSGNNADLEINCGDIGIDKVKFSQMPAIIPVIIISDGDIITVNVSVKSEFQGHSYKSDNIILVSQGGYVSLMLAKTNIGYFVIGSNNRTDL